MSYSPQVESFRKLHEAGCFVMPNPWDFGSARWLRGQGFKALASTSAGFAFTQGRADQDVPRDMMLAHIAELVKGTQKGILLTRTWYIRMVDPQTVLLTGLTRDGTFYIENGQIKHPVKNFRFNESPVIMLNNIDELGKPVRVAGDESSYVMMIPPMKLRDFTFTSLSDAV